MGDYDGLIAAIRQHPAEDQPRLLFADWLDEHGTTDLDRARAEFIRLSCGVGYGGDRKRHKVRLGVKEGRWIDANWQRLMPTLVKAATPECWTQPNPLSDIKLVDHAAGGIRLRRTGSDIQVRFYWKWDSARKDNPSRYSGLTFTIRFWRGFLDVVSFYNVRHALLLGGLICQDDPIASPVMVNHPVIQTVVDGAFTGCSVSSVQYGPLFPLIRGHSDEQDREYGLLTKWFMRVSDDPEFTVPTTLSVVYSSIDSAIEEWCRLNLGKSMTHSAGDPTFTPYHYVQLPIDLNTNGRSS